MSIANPGTAPQAQHLQADTVTSGQRLQAAASILILALWLVCVAAGLVDGRDKLVGISALAFAAMLIGWWAAEGLRVARAVIVAFDGLAAGAMLTSACLFLLPTAMAGRPTIGGLGVAAGLLVGAGLDRLLSAEPGRDAVADSALLAITLHAITAGFAIGLIYAQMPTMGWLLGAAIVAHKMPAGYALARRRQYAQIVRHPILWPACGVGLTAIPVGLLAAPGVSAASTACFGLATGVFIHVALNIVRGTDASSRKGSRLAFTFSTFAGAVGIVLIWIAV